MCPDLTLALRDGRQCDDVDVAESAAENGFGRASVNHARQRLVLAPRQDQDKLALVTTAENDALLFEQGLELFAGFGLLKVRRDLFSQLENIEAVPGGPFDLRLLEVAPPRHHRAQSKFLLKLALGFAMDGVVVAHILRGAAVGRKAQSTKQRANGGFMKRHIEPLFNLGFHVRAAPAHKVAFGRFQHHVLNLFESVNLR